MTIQWGHVMSQLTGQDKSFADALRFAVDLYTCGWSLRDIAEEGFAGKVSRVSIRNLLTTAGVKLRGRGGPNHMKHIHVPIEDYKQLTYQELAKKYKCSTTTIFKLTEGYRCSCGKRKCTGDLCHSTDPHEGDPYP